MSPELQMNGTNGTNGTVALGTGPPTREEMIVYYPPKFTWDQLRTFINAGDLGLLKRDRALQKRFDSVTYDMIIFLYLPLVPQIQYVGRRD
jgi:hypothetical protein